METMVEDTPDHNLRECPKWSMEWESLRYSLGVNELPSINEIIPLIVAAPADGGDRKWQALQAFCGKVVSTKETDDRNEEHHPRNWTILDLGFLDLLEKLRRLGKFFGKTETNNFSLIINNNFGLICLGPARMEKDEKLSITTVSSPMSIPSTEDKRKEEDPLYTNYPLWSTRAFCFQAYITFVMSFPSVLQFCKSLGNYGPVMFIPHFLFKTIICVPVVMLELVLGRYIMGNVSKAWDMCPLAKGVLYSSLSINVFAIVCNYISLTYLMKYLEACLHGTIPWQFCLQPWARHNCFDNGNNLSAYINCMKKYNSSFCKEMNWESSSEQFWKYQAANTNSAKSIGFCFLFLCIFIVIIIIINYKGIKSLEKVLLWVMCIPLVVSSVLAFATFLIPGATLGLQRIATLDWSLLVNVKVWVKAFEDSLLSLNVSLLAITFVSSHGRFLDDIFVDLLVVIFADLFCCLLIVIPVLSIITMKKLPFFDSNWPAVPIFADEDSVFVAISEALLEYPYPRIFWTILFYFSMVILSLGTQIIMVATFCDAFIGLFPRSLGVFYVYCTFGAACFVMCAPVFFLKLRFQFPLASLIVMNIFLSITTLECFYGCKRFNDDFYFMMGYPPPLFFRFTWILVMILTVIIMLLKIIYHIPDEPMKNVVILYFLPPICIYVGSAIHEMYKAFKKGKIKYAFLANPDWGPDNALLKKSRIIFNSRAVTKEFMYRQELYKKPFMKPTDFTEQNIVQLI